MSRDSVYLSRRMLLAGLGAGAVGAATASPAFGLPALETGSGRPSSWWDRTFLSLRSAGLSEWSALVGESFDLDAPDGPHRLRVAAVAGFPQSGSRPASIGRSQAFSVVFEAAAGAALPATDRLYRISHHAYPPLPIFMSAPVSSGGKTRLVAVFN